LEKELHNTSFTTSRRERAIAVAAHAAILVMEFVPFLNVLIVFLIWAPTRTHSAFIRLHTIETLNFSIAGTALYALCMYGLPAPYSVVTAAAINIAMITGCVRLALYASQGRFVLHIPHIGFVK